MKTEQPPPIEQQARELLREFQVHIRRLDREIVTLKGKLRIVLECMRSAIYPNYIELLSPYSEHSPERLDTFLHSGTEG